MKAALWGVLGVLALIWSALAWLFFSLAGAGGAAVVAVTRWLDLDPLTTQWLADGLALAGGAAQWLVGIAWGLGMAVLGAIGWMGGRAQDLARERAMNESFAYREPAIDGEIRDRKVSQKRPTDGKIG